MIERSVLFVGFITSVFIAVVCLGNPGTALINFGITVDDTIGRSEVRGQYGGLFVMVSIVLALSFFDRLPRRFGLGVLLTIYAGIFLGRIIHLAIEGFHIFESFTRILQIGHLIEFVAILSCLFALTWGRTVQPLEAKDQTQATAPPDPHQP